MKLYIDTNVVIDAVEGRKNRFGRNVGNPASDLFYATISCKHTLIISSYVLEELHGLRKIEQTRMFFEFTKKKVIKTGYTHAEKYQARLRSNDNEDDALHIIIAEREQADCIVTGNTKHFLAIGTSIPIRRPEELI